MQRRTDRRGGGDGDGGRSGGGVHTAVDGGHRRRRPRHGAAGRPADVAPQLLAAMKRDLGLDADQAAARLKRAKWASGVAAELRSADRRRRRRRLAGQGRHHAEDRGDRRRRRPTRCARPAPCRCWSSAASSSWTRPRRRSTTSAAEADRDLPGWYVDVATNKVVVRGQARARPTGAEDAGRRRRSRRPTRSRSSRPRRAAEAAGRRARRRPVLHQHRRRHSPLLDRLLGRGRLRHRRALRRGRAPTTTGFNEQAQGAVAASVFPGNADMGFVEINADCDPAAGGQRLRRQRAAGRPAAPRPRSARRSAAPVPPPARSAARSWPRTRR